jgi:hypothetical protein
MSCRQQILAAAGRISDRLGRSEWTIPEIIAEMRTGGSPYADSTIRTHICSIMCVGAPRNHGVAYEDLVRVTRGLYRLGSSKVRSASKERAPSSPPGDSSVGSIATERIERLRSHFTRYVRAFTAEPAFGRRDQLRLHAETIRRRVALGSAKAALRDDDFLDLLHGTLRAWGIGIRGSHLLDRGEFKVALRRHRAAIERLDGQMIDDPRLDVPHNAAALWELIRTLQIVDSQAPLVAGSKALHHLLPDLVVPMDREYTRRFFGWWANRFQYQQERFFVVAFEHLATAARGLGLPRHVGPAWASSRTKVLDNAIVAFCRIESLPRYGG